MRYVHRVIAISPTSRGFGFAVIEDGVRLVDYGLVEVRPPRTDKLVERFASLIHRHRPDTLVVRETRGSRFGKRSRRLLEGVAELAAEKGLEVLRPALEQVRHQFGGRGATRHDRAVEVAERFPGLAAKLPRKRKPWQSEDEWMAVFGALALLCLHND